MKKFRVSLYIDTHTNVLVREIVLAEEDFDMLRHSQFAGEKWLTLPGRGGTGFMIPAERIALIEAREYIPDSGER